jgi:hypothetical protein
MSRGDLKGHGAAIDRMLDAMAFRDAIRACSREGISEAEAAVVFERYRISQDIADDESDEPLKGREIWRQ